MWKYVFWGYIALISIISIITAVHDKRAAVRGKWRVSEAALMWLGAAGGALAMFITMKIIRHKTQRAKFMVGLPLLALIWIVAAIFLHAHLPA